jgi:hypothetical protein
MIATFPHPPTNHQVFSFSIIRALTVNLENNNSFGSWLLYTKARHPTTTTTITTTILILHPRHFFKILSSIIYKSNFNHGNNESPLSGVDTDGFSSLLTIITSHHAIIIIESQFKCI